MLTKLGQRNGCHVVPHEQWQLVFRVTRERFPGEEMQPRPVCILLSLTHGSKTKSNIANVCQAWLEIALTKLGQRNGSHLVAHEQQWQLVLG